MPVYYPPTTVEASNVGQIDEALFISGTISPTTITSNQNNYNPTDLSTASVVRMTSDASRDITGFAGGAAGRVLFLFNIGANPIVLKNDTTSTAANRFLFGVDRTLEAGRSIIIVYDSTVSRWRDVSQFTKATASDIQSALNDEKFLTALGLSNASLPQTLTDGATISWNMASGFNAEVTLAGNRAVNQPTNPKKGWTYALIIIQDATGSRTLSWHSSVDWGIAGAPTLTTGAGKIDIAFLYCYDATTPKFRASINKATP